MAEVDNKEDEINLEDPQYVDQTITKIFQETDKDKNGYIDESELEAMLINVANELGNKQPSKQEVREVLKFLDKNDDNQLSLDEFKILALRLLQYSKKIQTS